MNLIVAVEENWGIGNKNKLLAHIPEDLKYFKENTLNKTIVMGRKTFESLPKGALPNRKNIVLTRQKELKIDGCTVYNSIEDILNLDNQDDIFIIGGEQIYKQFLPYCKKAYVTKILKSYKHDCYFPNLDQDDNWKLSKESEIINSKKGITFKFTIYKNL